MKNRLVQQPDDKAVGERLSNLLHGYVARLGWYNPDKTQITEAQTKNNQSHKAFLVPMLSRVNLTVEDTQWTVSYQLF